MFIEFFILLKKRGIPVSLTEFLNLLQALEKQLVHNVEEFYYLSRSILIKSEQNFDHFDQLFGMYFKGMEFIPDEYFYNIPSDWLKTDKDRLFTEEEMERIKALGGFKETLERLKSLFQEQKEKHQGGNKWIGTNGTSPFGAYGYNPEGIRIGQDTSRHRRAIKVWDERKYKDLSDEEELETRNLKIALRKLRKITREGREDELNIEATIQETSKQGGILNLEMQAKKENNVKILLLLDVGGSMDDYIERCSQLFSAAKYEFKHLEFYYFHNCVYEYLWRSNKRKSDHAISTFDLIHKFNSDYKLIFVSDASMSPYEIMMQYGAIDHYNEEAGIVWMNRLKKKFTNLVWLNPVPVEEWPWTRSIQMLKEFTNDNMYPLTLNGISEAVNALK